MCSRIFSSFWHTYYVHRTKVTRMEEFLPVGSLFTLDSFSLYHRSSTTNWATFSSVEMYALICTKMDWATFGATLSQTHLGPMLWFFKYFRRKIQQKLAFLTQNKAKLCKIFIITLVFEKNANFSPKIVIITSTPGHVAKNPISDANVWRLAW
jgi:hypothetical protein